MLDEGTDGMTRDAGDLTVSAGPAIDDTVREPAGYGRSYGILKI